LSSSAGVAYSAAGSGGRAVPPTRGISLPASGGRSWTRCWTGPVSSPLMPGTGAAGAAVVGSRHRRLRERPQGPPHRRRPLLRGHRRRRSHFPVRGCGVPGRRRWPPVGGPAGHPM